jgi:hypothetical protein
MLFDINFIFLQSKHTTDIKTSVLYVNGQATLVTMDYVMDISDIKGDTEDSVRYG